MKKQLDVLDNYLRAKRPDFYSMLNKPLKENQIQALEEKFNITLAKDLKELYQWKNGQRNDCYDIRGIFTSEQGQLIEFWHADNDRNIIAPNLQCFIEAINEFYEAKEEKDFDEYFEIGNIKGFPKRFYVE